MQSAKWFLVINAVAAAVEDVGDAIATAAGKWSMIHLALAVVGVPFPDGSDGLATEQKAMMVGLYSETAF